MLRAAKVLLEAQDADRIERVLSGGEGLIRVARELRDHVSQPTMTSIRIVPQFDDAIAAAS